MRILCDCRYTRLDHHDGISRYGARVTEALSRRHAVTMLISDERQLALLPDLPWIRVSAPTSPREPFIAAQITRAAPDADVLWSPMQTIGSLGRRYGLVLTLHDLIYYEHRTPPRNLPGPVRLLWRLYHLAYWPQRLLLNRADEVATVSETTRRLMAEHRLTRRRVTIVTNAADVVAGAAPRTMPSGRDLVYMGEIRPYKGADTLARAMRELPGWRLHLLSRMPADERPRLEAMAPGGSLVIHDGTSDADYAELLDRAFALVHASRAEGFGIPLVEAMSHGTPVVASDIPIFREVGAGAASYFPVGDPHALARELRRLEDPQLWAERSAASLARAAHYDWDDAAAALLEVLERVHAARRRR
ncbi:MAG: glycosyltransferase family 4 protein [Micrococcales bacterium]|nr:glycosyltransferase family 4 protein [Micrococcales bacterium]